MELLGLLHTFLIYSSALHGFVTVKKGNRLVVQKRCSKRSKCTLWRSRFTFASLSYIAWALPNVMSTALVSSCRILTRTLLFTIIFFSRFFSCLQLINFINFFLQDGLSWKILNIWFKGHQRSPKVIKGCSEITTQLSSFRIFLQWMKHVSRSSFRFQLTMTNCSFSYSGPGLFYIDPSSPAQQSNTGRSRVTIRSQPFPDFFLLERQGDAVIARCHRNATHPITPVTRATNFTNTHARSNMSTTHAQPNAEFYLTRNVFGYGYSLRPVNCKRLLTVNITTNGLSFARVSSSTEQDGPLPRLATFTLIPTTRSTLRSRLCNRRFGGSKPMKKSAMSVEATKARMQDSLMQWPFVQI